MRHSNPSYLNDNLPYNLEQQDKAKLKNQKRELILVLFRVSESEKNPEENKHDDLNVFGDYCRIGNRCEKLTLESAVRLGEFNANYQTDDKIRQP